MQQTLILIDGQDGIRTHAPEDRPNSLAGSPLNHLSTCPYLGGECYRTRTCKLTITVNWIYLQSRFSSMFSLFHQAFIFWSRWRDSNPQSSDWKSDMLAVTPHRHYGLPGRIRTYDRRLRRALLYPAELQRVNMVDLVDSDTTTFPLWAGCSSFELQVLEFSVWFSHNFSLLKYPLANYTEMKVLTEYVGVTDGIRTR